jgi:hypothetical protein
MLKSKHKIFLFPVCLVLVGYLAVFITNAIHFHQVDFVKKKISQNSDKHRNDNH